MPGVTKKKMYIGKSLSDLNKAVDQGIDKSDKSNPRRLGSTAVKIMRAANEAYKVADEERAYILYMRYALMWRTISTSPQYKKDRKYFEDLLGRKNVTIAIENAEELSKSLETRYKDAAEEEEVMAKLAKESGAITNGDTSDGIEENGVAAETPEEKVLGTAGWLKASELYEVVKGGEITVLVMDVRSADQYAASQMSNIPSINVPREIIQAGATVKAIEKGLPSESTDAWRRRGNFDYVLLVDWDSSEEGLRQGSTLASLKDALFKWDSAKALKHEPLVLRGGYTDWILRYPMYSSNPRVAKPPSYESLLKPKNSLDFDYPDLDDKPTPVVPPPSEEPAPGMLLANNFPSVNRTLKPQPINSQPPPSNSQAAPAVMNVLAKQLSEGNNRTVTNASTAETNMEKPVVSDVSTAKSEGSKIALSVPTVNRSVKPKHIDVEQGPKEEDKRGTEVSTEDKTEIPPPVEGSSEQEEEAARAAAERKEREEFDALRKKEEEAKKQLEQMRVEKTKMENKELKEEKRALEKNIQAQQEEMAKLEAEMQALRARQSKPKPATAPSPGEATPSPNLPAGWEMKWDNKRQKYYYIDHSSRTSHWQLPAKAWENASSVPPTTSSGGQSSTTALAVKATGGPGGSTKPAGPTQSISPQPASGKDQTKPDSLKLAKPSPTTPQSKGTSKVPLKSLDSPASSTLKRSFSSPNIAKMLEDEEEFRKHQDGARTPTVDRSKKPSSRPTPAQMQHQQQLVVRKRNLDPVYGSQARALTGLRNLGNTCFMNSVVQCLSNTTLLSKYLLEGTYLKDINENNPLGRKGEVAVEFAVVVKALWAGQYKSIAPRDLLRTVIKYVPEFNQKIGHHHDSQEFLVFLMDGLHEDLNQVKKRQYMKEEDFSHLPSAEGSLKSWKNHLILNRSVIVDLFQGQFRSVVRCLACKNDSVKYEAFMFLELPIPSKTKCTLQDCLEKFQSVEKLTGSNATMCSKCKKLQDSVKTIGIWKLPHILIMHLKRFYYEGMWRQKLQTNVDYPLTSLDMRRYTSNTAHTGGGVYDLYGVSNHTGTLDGGHYTAYCKSAVNRKWYKYDDTEVFDCSVGKIRSVGAYILFYTSVHLPEP